MILTLALQRWLTKVVIVIGSPSPLYNLTLLLSRLDGLFGLAVTNLPLKGSILTGNTISQPTCLFWCSGGLPVWSQTDPVDLPSPTNLSQEL